MKKIGILVGACVLFALNKWHQDELLKKRNEEENST